MLKFFYPCFRLGLHLARPQSETEQGQTPPSVSKAGERLNPDPAERFEDHRDRRGALPIKGEEDQAAAFRKHRREFLKKLAEAEHGIMTGWGPEAAAVARRMATVWLDEILIKSSWPGRQHWLRKPLQSEWGEGRSGGLWFFQQLEQLSPARKDDRELAALALRCISLGLTGCYGREPDQLNEVRKNIQDRFEFKDDQPLFPPPPPPAGAPKARIGPAGRRLLAALILIPLLFWLWGGLSLGRTLDKINSQTAVTSPFDLEPPSNSLHGRLDLDRSGGRAEEL